MTIVDTHEAAQDQRAERQDDQHGERRDEQREHADLVQTARGDARARCGRAVGGKRLYVMWIQTSLPKSTCQDRRRISSISA
ncbi:hypothetical protein [Caballeronia sp. LZ001]|uniref:hypothetical protein n=1 Tax=Caballeronia sp. LZ001 TaxID=3038553 RepID=UPI0028594187|nr:hypothetical protein [Caballeronia sp. LZ001]MDR5802720.1 hypothetical protein [Caballeronia sp. LZ001]